MDTAIFSNGLLSNTENVSKPVIQLSLNRQPAGSCFFLSMKAID